jgi:hypothetical protein
VCADQDTAEEGDACRQRLLAADEGRNFKGSYKTLTAGPESTCVIRGQYVGNTWAATAAAVVVHSLLT